MVKRTSGAPAACRSISALPWTEFERRLLKRAPGRGCREPARSQRNLLGLSYDQLRGLLRKHEIGASGPARTGL
jgi:hypothetical protein